MTRHSGEWREELAASTVTGPSRTPGASAPRVPGLTLAAHPDVRRVGERVALPEIPSGRSVELSRLAPLFSPPDGGSPEPLADPHLSRSPLLLAPGPAPGSVFVRRGDSSMAVEVDGRWVQAEYLISAADLERGAVLLLAGRIVLVLHPMPPAPAREIERLGLIGDSAAPPPSARCCGADTAASPGVRELRAPRSDARSGSATCGSNRTFGTRLGRMDDARRTLATLLERFPNDRSARSFLAQLELGSGSVETAARLYAELVQTEPTFTELSNLGVAELLLGRYDAAAASFRQALGLLPESPAAVLNLADAEWLRGEKTAAAALYGKVIDLAARDPAPTFWQTQTIRAQALAHLGRRDEAVAAVQQALRTAPDNPQVAYEASLVYALAGETASARVNAERARANGYDRRWFSFPWFDGLGLAR